mgnify:CR=1 FL=1
MKRIDLYIIRVSLVTLFMCILTCTLLFVVFDIFENLKRFIDFGEHHSLALTLQTVALYYCYLMPSLTFIYLPFVTLLACIVTILLLNRKSEMSTLQSFGVSVIRLSFPFLLIGVLVSAAISFSKEKIIPGIYFKHIQIKNKLYYFDNIWNRSVKNIIYRETISATQAQDEKKNNNLELKWMKGGTQLISINLFDPLKKGAAGVTITRLNKKGDIIAQGNFNSATWSRGEWLLTNGWLEVYDSLGEKAVKYDLREQGAALVKDRTIPLNTSALRITCSLSLKELLMLKQKPETLSYTSLNLYPEPLVAKLEQLSRLILPFFVLTLIFVGVCIAIKTSVSKLFLAMGLFILLILGFQTIDSAFKEAALNASTMVPTTAILMEAAVLLALSLLTYRWAEQ